MASTTQEHADTTRMTVPRRRLRHVVAGGLCALAVVYLVAEGLSRNVVYFRTVSEAVQRREAEGGRRFRMAGAVLPGSLRATTAGVVFRITDGRETASVIHRGNPPELFKEGAPVVCEGRWAGGDFACDRIMIKHGEEYRPPAVDMRARREPASER